MDDKKRIDELEAKVAALEYLLKHSYWQMIIAQADEAEGDVVEIIRTIRDLAADMRDDLDRTAVPGVDPATSDHLSAGARDHVERFFEALASEMIANEDDP